jgi:hypothetical protein
LRLRDIRNSNRTPPPLRPDNRLVCKPTLSREQSPIQNRAWYTASTDRQLRLDTAHNTLPITIMAPSKWGKYCMTACTPLPPPICNVYTNSHIVPDDESEGESTPPTSPPPLHRRGKFDDEEEDSDVCVLVNPLSHLPLLTRQTGARLMGRR